MRRPIARIKINAGNPGWYDPLTNIHLTLTRPEGVVYEGANTTNIKKGVAFKLVSVIEGSLETTIASKEIKEEIIQQVREVSPQIEEPKVKVVEETIEETIEETLFEEPATVIEEVITEEAITEVVEEIIEEVVEEVIEEKPKKKTTRKSKTKKETAKEK